MTAARSRSAYQGLLRVAVQAHAFPVHSKARLARRPLAEGGDHLLVAGFDIRQQQPVGNAVALGEGGKDLAGVGWPAIGGQSDRWIDGDSNLRDDCPS